MSKKEIQALLANKDAFEAAAKKGYEEVDVNKNGLIDFEEVEAILANFQRETIFLNQLNQKLKQFIQS